MKNMVFGAVALCAVATFASQIESANVVGYANLNVAKGNTFQLAGVQFSAPGGGDAKVADFVKPSSSVVCWNVETGDSYVFEDWLDRAPQIQIPDGLGGYYTYYYVTKAWDDAAQDFTADGIGVWADNGGMKVDPVVAPGVGFWLKTPKTNAAGEVATEGLTFVVAGGVPAATTVTRNGTAFVLASIPAPVDIAIDDSKITWNLNPIVCWDVESGESFVDDEWLIKAPQIQIPDGFGGYFTYYYVTKAWDDAAQDFTADGVGVWVDNGGMKVTATIPAGVGVWFKVPNATDAGFGFSLSDVTK